MMKNNFMPRRVVTMSPEAYLNMTPARRANVKSARFVPPELGDRHFGRFEVMLKFPEYRFYGRK